MRASPLVCACGLCTCRPGSAILHGARDALCEHAADQRPKRARVRRSLPSPGEAWHPSGDAQDLTSSLRRLRTRRALRAIAVDKRAQRTQRGEHDDGILPGKQLVALASRA